MDEQDSLFEQREPENRKVQRYTLQDGTHISSRELANAKHEVQLDAMRRWFYKNYEDPVHSCPHDSREGGISSCMVGLTMLSKS